MINLIEDKRLKTISDLLLEMAKDNIKGFSMEANIINNGKVKNCEIKISQKF